MTTHKTATDTLIDELLEVQTEIQDAIKGFISLIIWVATVFIGVTVGSVGIFLYWGVLITIFLIWKTTNHLMEISKEWKRK